MLDGTVLGHITVPGHMPEVQSSFTVVTRCGVTATCLKFCRSLQILVAVTLPNTNNNRFEVFYIALTC